MALHVHILMCCSLFLCSQPLFDRLFVAGYRCVALFVGLFKGPANSRHFYGYVREVPPEVRARLNVRALNRERELNLPCQGSVLVLVPTLL